LFRIELSIVAVTIVPIVIAIMIQRMIGTPWNFRFGFIARQR
jgi:hypothetical protein